RLDLSSPDPSPCRFRRSDRRPSPFPRRATPDDTRPEVHAGHEAAVSLAEEADLRRPSCLPIRRRRLLPIPRPSCRPIRRRRLLPARPAPGPPPQPPAVAPPKEPPARPPPPDPPPKLRGIIAVRHGVRTAADPPGLESDTQARRISTFIAAQIETGLRVV